MAYQYTISLLQLNLYEFEQFAVVRTVYPATTCTSLSNARKVPTTVCIRQ
jgi:hypothetical protein